jgi:hypothetical protein
MNSHEPNLQAPTVQRARGWMFIVLLGNVAMLAVAATFYGWSFHPTDGRAVHQALLTMAIGGASPFACVILLALFRRYALSAITAITASLVYVVGFGWYAVLLALLSWGDKTLQLPAAAIPIQLVTGTAAILAWRRIPPAARGSHTVLLGTVVPIALSLVAVLAAVLVVQRVERAPQAANQDRTALRTDVAAIVRCLKESRGGGRGYPRDLSELGPAGTHCLTARQAARQSGPYLIDYIAGPPDMNQRRTVYSLCTLPRTAPDTGLLAIVADESGHGREMDVSSMLPTELSCARVWIGDALGVAGAVKHCLLEFALRNPAQGYPNRLPEFAGERGACWVSIPNARRDGSGALLVESGQTTLVLRYVPGSRDRQGIVSSYRLYANCAGQRDSEVLDEHGQIVNMDPRASWIAQNCREPAAEDAATLAGIETVAANRPSLTEPTGTAPAPRSKGTSAVNAPDRSFGDTPNLPARRSDCRRNPAGACYDLGRELERAVLQAGGNPYRAELLHDDAHIALALEANTAYARACEHGDAKGCAQSGDVLLSGRLVSEDVVKGAALIAKSCDLGLASGCASWGQILERGRQASRAVEARISVLPGGSGNTITAHVVDPHGPAIAADVRRAARVYERACELGDRDSCLAAARCFAEDPPTQAHALDLLARQCELGIAFACSSAAHLSGMMTLPPDAPGADEWRRRACALGWTADCRKP